MAPADPAPPDLAARVLHVEVVHCTGAGHTDLVALTVPAGSLLADAVRASGVLARHALAEDGLQAGVWGKVQSLQHPLRDGDRVEIYRPLRVDPKEARRLRYRQQGDGRSGRGTGLSDGG